MTIETPTQTDPTPELAAPDDAELAAVPADADAELAAVPADAAAAPPPVETEADPTAPPIETEAEAKARAARASHAARRANAQRPRVAFLACDSGGGGLVKVGQHDDAGHAVECPHCGRTHTTILPRPRQRGEDCEIELPPEPERAAAPSRVQKSDSDVLTAIGEDWTPVTEVAEALGYGNRGSLVNRLREMRQRGAPIETQFKHKGRPLYVRRAVKSD